MLQQYQMLEGLMYLIMVDAKDQKLQSGLVANVHLLNQFLDTVELPLHTVKHQSMTRTTQQKNITSEAMNIIIPYLRCN